MADVFNIESMRNLINGKYVIIFGDSNLRALYKDMIILLTSNRLISPKELKRKLEPSFLEDSLVHSSGLTRGRNFREHRVYTLRETVLEYFFITKCLSPDVTDTLNEILEGKRPAPDLLVVNSTLWDIARQVAHVLHPSEIEACPRSRFFQKACHFLSGVCLHFRFLWGSQSVQLFKENLKKLVVEFERCLPPSTLVIWLTAPPVSQIQGGFLIPEVEFLKHTMRFEVMEANRYAHELFAAHGFDVLDYHYYSKFNVHRRIADGIHWLPKAVRYMTNLLLTHISLSWNKPLPRSGGIQTNQVAILIEKLEPLPSTDDTTELSTLENDSDGTGSKDKNSGNVDCEKEISSIPNLQVPVPVNPIPVRGTNIENPADEERNKSFSHRKSPVRSKLKCFQSGRSSRGKKAFYRTNNRAGFAARRPDQAGPPNLINWGPQGENERVHQYNVNNENGFAARRPDQAGPYNLINWGPQGENERVNQYNVNNENGFAPRRPDQAGPSNLINWGPQGENERVNQYNVNNENGFAPRRPDQAGPSNLINGGPQGENQHVNQYNVTNENGFAARRPDQAGPSNLINCEPQGENERVNQYNVNNKNDRIFEFHGDGSRNNVQSGKKRLRSRKKRKSKKL